jgi:hypothetical protein
MAETIKHRYSLFLPYWVDGKVHYGANEFVVTPYPESESSDIPADTPMVVTAVKNTGDEHYPTSSGDVWVTHFARRRRFSNEGPVHEEAEVAALREAVAHPLLKTDPRNNRRLTDLACAEPKRSEGEEAGSDPVTYSTYLEDPPTSIRVVPLNRSIPPFIMRVAYATCFTNQATGDSKTIVGEPSGKLRFVSPGDYESAEVFSVRGRGRGLQRLSR